MIETLEPKIEIRFHLTEAGGNPVRAWIKELPRSDRRIIGEDLKTVQFGWPLGMPLVRKMQRDLWEVRIDLERQIARIFFTVIGRQMILLHGFIKKSIATPKDDLNVARMRLALVRQQGHRR